MNRMEKNLYSDCTSVNPWNNKKASAEIDMYPEFWTHVYELG